MDINLTIKNYKEKIDKRLRIFIKDRIKKVDKISPVAKEMMEYILEYNLRGGKRVRPILTVFGYKACGGKNENAIIDAALAVELMESFLLIHDDIMDQDELRRGYLTMHKIYENKCKRSYKSKNSKRFGESMAMIAGDIVAIMGSEAILNSKFPINNKLKAIDKFNSAVINTCFGQAIDVKSGYEKTTTEKDIKRLYELKTAIYTFEGPLFIGALLAGASKTKLASLKKYALPLGKAFQYQDDILGLYGTKKKIGKSIGSDIKEGKKTLLILKALEKANKSDTKFIQDCLGNNNITANDIKQVRTIVKNTGSLEYSKSKAFDYVEQSKKAIEKANLNKPGKEFLLGLADFVINREY
jgi:geranylgeranyl diphosphate synthase, type I